MESSFKYNGRACKCCRRGKGITVPEDVETQPVRPEETPPEAEESNPQTGGNVETVPETPAEPIEPDFAIIESPPAT